MAKIINHSARVMHPVYLVQGSDGRQRGEYLKLPGAKAPGVPPSVTDRIGPNKEKLPDLVEHEIPDDVAVKIAAHKSNALLFKSGLELKGVSEGKRK
jgi:hypothetical protein